MEERQKKVVEVEGKDIEDAIQKALGILGVKRKDVDIKVLSEENKGLFGMQGAKPAKVKVEIRK